VLSQKAPVTDNRAGLLTQAILFGVHASQVYRYYSTYSGDSLRYKCLVGWIFLLGTLQVLILVVSSWKYYVDGIWNPEVWGTFWWPLSFQDGLVSLLKRIGSGRRFNLRGVFADTPDGIHLSAVHGKTCMGTVWS
jgi:hypothetical protein